VVILGGLFTSTLLNLFVVPSLYLRFGRRRNRPMGEAS
jgi:Cu/Ag efflux pump CusA